VAHIYANPTVHFEALLPDDNEPLAPQAVEPGVTKVRALSKQCAAARQT